MIDERCCCNCLHCARWHTSKGVECHCDLDDKYLGYLTVMNTDNDCCKWEKQIKWELQEKHDREIYNKAIDDFVSELKENYENHNVDIILDTSTDYSYTNACYIFEDYIETIAGQLKENNMTIDKTIQQKKNLINEWEKELDMTPENDLTHLSGCKDMILHYSQEIEWLEELKELRELKQQLTEMDLSIPQHFAKEQSEWIKAYCIQKNKEFYDKGIDDFLKLIEDNAVKGVFAPYIEMYGERIIDSLVFQENMESIWIDEVIEIAEQLKGFGVNEEN